MIVPSFAKLSHSKRLWATGKCKAATAGDLFLIPVSYHEKIPARSFFLRSQLVAGVANWALITIDIATVGVSLEERRIAHSKKKRVEKRIERQ